MWNPSRENLLRCLRVLALTNEVRMDRTMTLLTADPDADLQWFVECIDDLAPALHERGWVTYEDFKKEPGSVVVTSGQGDVRNLVITDLGRAQIGAAVLQ